MSLSPENHFPSRLIDSERGGALIELSIVLPLLIVFAVLATNFGVALNERQMLVEAVRYGARRAAGSGLPDCEPIISRRPGVRPDDGDLNLDFNGTECLDALADENVPATLPADASVLGKFYGCQFLQQAGLNVDEWKVWSRIVSIGTFGNEGSAVRLRIYPKNSRRAIVSAILGGNFPSAVAEFSISRECGQTTFGAGDSIG